MDDSRERWYQAHLDFIAESELRAMKTQEYMEAEMQLELAIKKRSQKLASRQYNELKSLDDEIEALEMLKYNIVLKYVVCDLKFNKLIE